MRTLGLSILGILALTTTSLGQPAGQQNLNGVLRGWEKAMTDLQSFVSVVERTTLDKALSARDEHKGFAMFMKPQKAADGSKARLEMAKTSNTKIFEKYICTGPQLYEYVNSNNTVRVHALPKNKAMQESFLSFLFGMTAAEALERYDMDLVVANPPDKYYHYIRIRPKLAQDKGDFLEAQLSLYQSNNLPARIWYLQLNKSEVTWNFSKLQLNVQIPEKYFEPDLPQGWRVEQVKQKLELQGAAKGK